VKTPSYFFGGRTFNKKLQGFPKIVASLLDTFTLARYVQFGAQGHISVPSRSMTALSFTVSSLETSLMFTMITLLAYFG
jgi:hypothetical protein